MGIANSVVMTLKFAEQVDNTLDSQLHRKLIPTEEIQAETYMDGYDTHTLHLSQLGQADHRNC